MTKGKHSSDVNFIQELAALLRQHDLTELEVNRDYGPDDALNVRVCRSFPAPVAAAAPIAAPIAPAPIAAPAAAPAPAAQEADQANAVTSPMVGTAYLAAEPGGAPFVSVGTQVKEGDTLMIIEAMKTMNHIPAPHAGTVKRILVEDGNPVEFGSPLMVIA